MGVFEAQVCGNHAGTWPLVPLEGIVSKFIDYRGKSPEKTDTGVPLITAKNVRDGFLVEEPREFIASDEYDSWMRRGIPKKNDLLFTTEAPLGNVARVPTQQFALAQRIICLSPDSTKVHPSFFFWGMRSSSVQGRIRQNATGTTVFGIKQANLRKVLFPLPTLSVQREIAELCDSLAGARSKAEGHKSTPRGTSCHPIKRDTRMNVFTESNTIEQMISRIIAKLGGKPALWCARICYPMEAVVARRRTAPSAMGNQGKRCGFERTCDTVRALKGN